jgi:hypothetical protein
MYSIVVQYLVQSKFPKYRYKEADAQKAEQAFDTIYYLGFIGTLVAMVIGLTQPIQDIETTRIVSQNAIALATTVLGISLRTILTLSVNSQDSPDVDQLASRRSELERQMRFTGQQIAFLGDGSVRLAQKLDEVAQRIDQLKDFDEAYAEILVTIVHHANEAIESKILHDNEKFKKSIKVLAEESLKARSEISKSVEEISNSLSRLSEVARDNNSTQTIGADPFTFQVDGYQSFYVDSEGNPRAKGG